MGPWKGKMVEMTLFSRTLHGVAGHIHFNAPRRTPKEKWIRFVLHYVT